MSRSKVLAGAALVALLSAGTAWRAEAAITEIDIGINPTFEQTATGVTATGGFFAARAFLNSSTDFNGGTLTWPGAMSTQPLTPQTGAVLGYGFNDNSLDDLNAQFPFGTYTLTATNSSTMNSQTESLDYTKTADSLSTPTLSAASFNGLQDLKASSGFAFDFNTFVQNPNGNLAFVFLNVFNSSGQAVFSTNGLDPSTTSVFMPGNTLAAGQNYTFDLLFDDRITGTNGDNVPTPIFFDSHTDGVFSTSAVPEPATWTMMILGFGGLGLALRRHAAKTRGVFA